MGRAGKVAVVVGGYALAVFIGAVATAVHVAATQGPDRDSAQGMHAFGDLATFVAAFGVAALAPTAAALVFLRRSPVFWAALGALAVAVALTVVPGLLGLLEMRAGHATSAWGAFGFLRLLGAPLLLPLHGLAALLAPERRFRVPLLGSTAMELVACLALAAHLAAG